MKSFKVAAATLISAASAKGKIVGNDGLIHFDEQNALYYTPTNDPVVVDFVESAMSWSDFAKTHSWKEGDQIALSEVRKALYKYAKDRLYIPRRAPKRGDSFSDTWNHQADVLTQKAIKDTLIRDYIQVLGESSN